jgi:cobalt-zinc-cadmium resistance protein CzcA
VLGTALMIAGGNSRTVAQAAAARLEQVNKSLPADIVAAPVLDRSVLVNSTIKTVAKNLTEGALLVVVVLFLLLGNLRAATITALVIPLSFLFAVIGMNRFGISGNLMSLGALDFGILVDGAVIVVESTLLMLGQRRAELGRALTAMERLRVAADSAMKMARPAAFGQLIILLVFAPILTLEGVEGKTFHPMAATFMLALVGAFLFSFTFVPAMAALLVREPKVKDGDAHADDGEHETKLIRVLRARIEPVVRKAVAHPRTVLAGAVMMVVVGIGSFSLLGREFMPTLDEGNVAMQALRVPSTSLEQSLAMQLALEKAIAKQPEVETVFSRTGTAEAAIDPMPTNISDSVIVLKPRKDWPDPKLAKDALVARFEKLAGQQLGNSFEFSQPIELRFNELISGVRTDLAVMIFGDDFSQLQKVADQVALKLRAVNGAADVRVEQISGLPTLNVAIDHVAAAQYGLTAADVSDALSTGIGGTAAGKIFEGDRRFNVVVRLDDASRNDPDQLASLPIATPSGLVIPLSSVARITVSEGPNQISRNNGSRRVVVQANVRGRDLGGFVGEAQAAVADVALPPGAYLTWGGQFENLQRGEAAGNGGAGGVPADRQPAVHGPAQRQGSHSGVQLRAVGAGRRHPRAAAAWHAVLGVGGGRLHRRLRRGHLERPGADAGDPRTPGCRRPAAAGGDQRCLEPHPRGADHGAGGDRRLHSDGDCQRFRCGGAEAAGDGGDRWPDHRHRADPAGAADLRGAGGQAAGGGVRRGSEPFPGGSDR